MVCKKTCQAWRTQAGPTLDFREPWSKWLPPPKDGITAASRLAQGISTYAGSLSNHAASSFWLSMEDLNRILSIPSTGLWSMGTKRASESRSLHLCDLLKRVADCRFAKVGE